MKTLPNNTSKLTPEQQDIFEKIVSSIESKVFSVLKSTNIDDYQLSLTGAAGTGKTFLTTHIAKYLSDMLKATEKKEYRFTVTAPTHKAVGVLTKILFDNKIEASCRTLHSFLGIRPFTDYATGEEKFTIDKTKKVKESTSVLIVDESSMIGAELYEYIVEAIEDGRINMVLFIGDPYQLLPVDNSENKIYALKNSFVLNEVVRQAKDSYIIKLATKIRERIKYKNYIDIKQFIKENIEPEIEFFHNKESFLQDFYKNSEWYKENKILATFKNKDVDAFNRTVRNKYWEQQGNDTPSTLLQGDRLRFKDTYSVGDVTVYHNGQEIELGSAVLKYHNDLQIEYWECREINVTEQQIFRVVDPDSMKVFNDKLKIIAAMAKKASYPQNKYFWRLFFQTRDMFADVQYVHSSTIHKLQGSTYDVAYVDMFALAHNSYMSDDDKYRLFYVAITRASKDIKIFISAFENSAMSFNQTNGRDSVNIVEEHNNIDSILSSIDFRE
ncbi:MAG: ATPase [Epsilonproteobacteria bacterium]|nr:MAG: ATPase [Campylobacterota bacterium]